MASLKVQKSLIRQEVGVLDDLRSSFWYFKSQGAIFENDLKHQLHLNIDDAKKKLNLVPKDRIAQIKMDLNRTRSFNNTVLTIEDFNQISEVLQCIAYIFP